MNQRLVLKMLLASCVGPYLASIAAQQTSQVTPLLLVPGGTRAMGFGGAFVAGDGPEVLFYNPAQIGGARGTTISAERFGSSAALGSLATTTAVLGASIGFGMEYLEYGARHSNGSSRLRDLGRAGRYQASATVGLVGAAIERKGVRVGITTKFVQQQLPSGRSGMPAFDLGVATTVQGVNVGLSVLDADGLLAHKSPPSLRLPTRIAFGGMISGVSVGPWLDVAASASLTVEQNARLVPAGGVEVTYVPVSGWSLVGRVGGHRTTGIREPGQSGTGNREPGTGKAGLTLGASLGIDRLALDYAFEPDNVHRIGVRIR